MALVICQECGAKISSNAFSCPKCGSSTINKAIKTTAKISLAFWGSILGIVALLALFGAIISSNKPLEKTVSTEEVDNPFTSQKFGSEWPFLVSEIEVKCMRKKRGDTWSYVAYADGKYYSLNSSAKVWYYYPYPDEIMKPVYAYSIKGNFYSNGVLAKNLPLGTSAINKLANYTPFGDALSDFCGEWQ